MQRIGYRGVGRKGSRSQRELVGRWGEAEERALGRGGVTFRATSGEPKCQIKDGQGERGLGLLSG